MRKFLSLSSIIFLLIVKSSYGQITSSTWLSPNPSGTRYLDVKMSSINNVIAVGLNGTIVLSTDSGLNWQEAISNTSEYLSTISFPDQNYGFAGGSNGVILSTTNGGFTWAQQNSGVSTDLIESFFLDRFNGYMIGYNTILKYNGTSWTKLNHGFSGATFTDISFVSYTTGYICGRDGESFLIKTTDAGLSWNPIPLPQLNGDLYAMDFNGGNRGWLITSSGELLRTTDGGTTWDLSFVTSNYIYDIEFKSSDYGIIVGDNGTVLISADSGKTWNNKHPLGTEPDFVAVDNIGTFIIAVGDKGVISRSVAFVPSWVRKDLNSIGGAITNIEFLDNNSGFLKVEATTSEHARILKTTNAGLNWANAMYGIDGTVNDIEIISPSLAFAIVNRSLDYFVYKSTNNGESWNQIYSAPSIEKLKKIFFLNDNIGWVIGEYTLIQTTNGGNSWEDIPNQAGLFGTNDIFFIDNYRGFICKNNGKIYGTFDGGVTWRYLTEITGFELNKIAFADGNNGWIVGDGGKVLRTTNAGVNWFPVTTFNDNTVLNTKNFYAIKFANSQFGYIGGSAGTLFYTVDGGETWLSENSKFRETAIKSISFNASDKVLLGGDGGFLTSNTFTQSGLSVYLTAPFQGSTLTIGDTTEIKWVSQNIPYVDLSYSTNNGLSWKPITYNYPAAGGKYFWKVNYPRAEQVIIKISSDVNPSIFSQISEIKVSEPPLSWTTTDPNAGLINDFDARGDEAWIVSNNKVYYSNDAAKNFSEIYTHSGSPKFNAVKMSQGGKGIIAGNSGLVLYTTDSGYNWLPALSSVSANLNCIGQSSDKIFIGGSGGSLLMSSDGGLSWTNFPIDEPKNIIDIEFPSDQNGYLIVEYPASGTGVNDQYFWRTTNGGFVWEKTPFRYQAISVKHISFVSPTTGFGITGSAIIKTTDRGDNWKTLKQLDFYGHDVHFSNENFGWLTGSIAFFENNITHTEAITLQTTDGGVNWEYRSNGLYDRGIYKVYSPDNFSTYAISAWNIHKFTGSNTPYLKVTSPNGLDFIYVNTTRNITWDSRNITNVKIEYTTNNGSTWLTIVSSVNSTGSYSWAVPNTLSENCFIKITSVEDPQFYDVSDAKFTIHDPTPILELTTPNGSEALNYGDIYSITWNARNMGLLSIEFSIDSGQHWSQIEYTFPASIGKYNWKVPNTPSTNCLIKITDPINLSLFDISENAFTINSQTSSLTLISPNGGNVLRVGSKSDIIWSTGGGSFKNFSEAKFTKEKGLIPASTNSPKITNVNIDYSIDDGKNWIPLAASVEASLKIYQWAVPNLISNRCKIKISDTGNPTTMDVSDAVFSISDDLTLNNFILSINDQIGVPGDTLLLDLNLQALEKTKYNSGLIHINGFYGQLDFLEADTSGSILSKFNSDYVVNDQDSVVNITFASGTELNASGKLISMKFLVLPNASGSVPILIDSVLIDTGIYDVGIDNGSVQVLAPSYGDVDLNSQVQPFDASVILKHLTGSYPPFNLQQRLNAEVTLDNTISAMDASVILQYTANVIDSLPHEFTITPGGTIELPDFVDGTSSIISVPVVAINSKNLFSFEGSIRFDNAVLKYEKIKFSDELTGFLKHDTTQNGVIKFAAASKSGIDLSGTMITFEFSKKDSQTTSKTFIYYEKMRLNEAALLSNFDSCFVDFVTAINEKQIPIKFSLAQNYPNPFNPTTTISYDLPKDGKVTLKIYDALGREVKTLLNEYKPAGHYLATFNAAELASGVYIYKLASGEFSSVKKMILMK